MPLILQHIPLDSIRSARLDVRVGTGIVEVEADDQFVEIIRFSNLYADRFAKVSAKLDQRANGFPIEITETDNKDDRRCEKCGMATWATGGVCPRCVNKSAVIIRLFGLLRIYWPYGAAMLSLTMVGITTQLIPPRLQKILIDNVFGSEDPPSGSGVLRIWWVPTAQWRGWPPRRRSCARSALEDLRSMVNGRLALQRPQVSFDLRQRLLESSRSVHRLLRQKPGRAVAVRVPGRE